MAKEHRLKRQGHLLISCLQKAQIYVMRLKNHLSTLMRNDYRCALTEFAASHVAQNEYDRYITTPPPADHDTSEWWQKLDAQVVV